MGPVAHTCCSTCYVKRSPTSDIRCSPTSHWPDLDCGPPHTWCSTRVCRGGICRPRAKYGSSSCAEKLSIELQTLSKTSRSTLVATRELPPPKIRNARGQEIDNPQYGVLEQDAILDCGYLRPKEFLTLFTPFEGFNKISKHSKSHAPPSLSVYFQPVFTKNGGMPAQRSTCVCLGFECTTTNPPPYTMPWLIRSISQAD